MDCEITRNSKELRRLQALFAQEATLPVLSAAAKDLISDAIAGNDADSNLTDILARDRVLSSRTLRVIGDARSQPCASVEEAVALEGVRSLRSVALALSINETIAGAVQVASFDRERYVRHSLAVGMTAQHLFRRKLRLEQIKSTCFTHGEVFAAGYLHDLPTALLAYISPGDFAQVCLRARRTGTPISEAFIGHFGVQGGNLGVLAARTWKLPLLFQLTLEHLATPWNVPDEFDALSCLCYANYVAINRFGFTIAEFTAASQLPPELSLEFDVPVADLEALLCRIKQGLEGSAQPMQLQAQD